MQTKRVYGIVFGDILNLYWDLGKILLDLYFEFFNKMLREILNQKFPKIQTGPIILVHYNDLSRSVSEL